MEQRRAVSNLNLAFDTSPAKVAAIPAMVRGRDESQAHTRFERSHLLSIAETGLRIENVYYVTDPDYGRYADIQHAINLELLRRLRREKIEFGFATRTMMLRSAEGTRGVPGGQRRVLGAPRRLSTGGLLRRY